MRFYPFYLLLIFVGISCTKPTDLDRVLNCNTDSYSNLEQVLDAKKQFSIPLPKSWKTNLFFDEIQSSIYSADTTLQLTQTTLIDITLFEKNIDFSLDFKKKSYLTHYKNQLDEKISKELTVINKPAYLTLSEGKKGNFPYQIAEIYIQTNPKQFILAKIEVYGDSLAKKRLCKAFKLIDNIDLK